MKWIEVETELDSVTRVANFLDGILVSIPSPFEGVVYIPGYEVAWTRGDMARPAIRRRPTPAPPSYHYVLAPILGEIGK